MKSKTLIHKIISNPVIQTIVIYVSGAWVMIELVEYLIEHFSVNEQVRNIILIILLCGLPITMFLAWYISRDKETASVPPDGKTGVSKIPESKKPSGKYARLLKRPRLIVPGLVLILLLIVAGIRYFNWQAKIRWANKQAMPEIEQLFNEMNHVAAFHLVQKAEKYISEDPKFKELSSLVSTKLTILTDPPGADIYLKEYAEIEGEWRFLGVTPIDSIRMPIRTFYRWKIEKPGYETVVAIAATSIDTLYRKFDEKGTIPPGMVRVIGQNTDEGMIPDFFIDKYEVTNKQFKEFLNAGGYQKQDYWKHKFVKDGEVLTWEEAMDEFRDMTGRSGPSAWQAGDYPDGQDDYPVTGVSWYEAAAYVEFLGKSLPTTHHWGIAAGFNMPDNHWIASLIFPLSNFKGSGAVPVGSSQGVNCFGAYDMAGNVREWCWNESQEGRFIRGGAWNDIIYMYSYESQLPSFNRSSKNGFRGVHYIDRDKITENIFQPFEYTELRDYYKEEPVSDAIFQVYKNQFLYDNAELEADVYETDESSDDWTIEKITFNAAYGNERVIAYVYLPKETSPPYQTLIFFPGAGAAREGSIKDNLHAFWFFDFILKNGRAVMFPVYKGSYERNNGLTNEMRHPNQSHGHTEYLVKWVKDFSRSIDYLETRPDIDSNKLVYFGQSWGGHLGAIIPAVEERLRVSILHVGGLHRSIKALPEADAINYVSRVKIPVLMLNGRYDYNLPLETSVIPMYDLLGTPDEHKVLKIYETDHFVPKNEMIKETLNWLDKYLGPINK